MRPARVTHVMFELVQMTEGTKNGAVRSVETYKNAVAEIERGVRVIDGGKKRRAANVAEGCGEAEARRNGACVLHCGIALVIEKTYPEAWVDGRLVWIGDRSVDLVQAEAREQCGFI